MIKHKSNFLKVFLYLFFAISCVNLSIAEKIEDLNVDRYVNDFAGIIDDDVENALNQKLYDLNASTTNQVVVVTVNNLDGDYIEHYSIKLAEKIKAGNEKNDNGVILLVAKEDREMRIEVGYGLESTLTDGKSSYIIENILIPNFKNGDYTAGIKEGVDAIVGVVTDANFEIPSDNSDSESTWSTIFGVIASVFFWIIWIFVIVFQWIAAILGRTKSWWLGGVFGLFIGVIIWIFTTSLLFSGLATAILVFLGLVFDYYISKNYKSYVAGSKSSPSWWSGGNWGPSSGSGSTWTSSSSGGFGGGGGSFGGGGSSGKW
jgi:uncharacterized protein